MVLFMNQNLKPSNFLEVRFKLDKESNFILEKLFIVCIFDCYFQHFKKKVWQWVKEQIDGIIIDYDLVKIIEQKFHPFYNV